MESCWVLLGRGDGFILPCVGIYLKFLGNPMKLLQTQNTYFYVGFPEVKRGWVDVTYDIFAEGGMVNVHFNPILQEKMFR